MAMQAAADEHSEVGLKRSSHQGERLKSMEARGLERKTTIYD